MRFETVGCWTAGVLAAIEASQRLGCPVQFVAILGSGRVLEGVFWLAKECAGGCAVWHAAMTLVSASITVISWGL